jgi:D-tyrosyl-tRNA(Tyr) deacylase
MRIVLQRIREGKVTIRGEEICRAGPGLCLFVAIARGDTRETADYLVEKVIGLRIFEDESGKMNRSLAQVNGEILVVSEFTLYGDCAKGRRPSFTQAAPPEEAEMLYHYFVGRLEDSGLRVATGTFQATMEVAMTNDGPVTFILDSR